MVPAVPATASEIRSNDVITVRAPPVSTNRQAASTFGPMLPLANWPSSRVLAQLANADPIQGLFRRCPEPECDMVDVGRDHQHVDVEGPAEDRRRQVLVDDGLHPVQRPVLDPDDGHAAAAGTHDHETCPQHRCDRRSVENCPRFGGCDDPSPAPLAPVLPGLAVLDHHAGLVARKIPPDRFGRSSERGVVGVHQSPGNDSSDWPGRPDLSQAALQCVEQDEADGALGLRSAPVQRNRWHHRCGDLVLHQQVANLWAVAVGDHDVVALGCHPGDPIGCDPDRRDLVLGPGPAAGRCHGVAPQRNEYTHAESLSRHRRDPQRQVAARLERRADLCT